MGKHTPGPWFFKENKHADNIGIYKDATSPGDSWPSAECIAFLDTVDGDSHAPIETALPNAHLISAAPDLLSSAQAAAWGLDRWIKANPETGGLWRDILLALNKAISKAEGHNG